MNAPLSPPTRNRRLYDPSELSMVEAAKRTSTSHRQDSGQSLLRTGSSHSRGSGGSSHSRGSGGPGETQASAATKLVTCLLDSCKTLESEWRNGSNGGGRSDRDVSSLASAEDAAAGGAISLSPRAPPHRSASDVGATPASSQGRSGRRWMPKPPLTPSSSGMSLPPPPPLSSSCSSSADTSSKSLDAAEEATKTAERRARAVDDLVNDDRAFRDFRDALRASRDGGLTAAGARGALDRLVDERAEAQARALREAQRRQRAEAQGNKQHYHRARKSVGDSPRKETYFWTGKLGMGMIPLPPLGGFKNVGENLSREMRDMNNGDGANTGGGGGSSSGRTGEGMAGRSSSPTPRPGSTIQKPRKNERIARGA